MIISCICSPEYTVRCYVAHEKRSTSFVTLSATWIPDCRTAPVTSHRQVSSKSKLELRDARGISGVILSFLPRACELHGRKQAFFLAHAWTAAQVRIFCWQAKAFCKASSIGLLSSEWLDREREPKRKVKSCVNARSWGFLFAACALSRCQLVLHAKPPTPQHEAPASRQSCQIQGHNSFLVVVTM